MTALLALVACTGQEPPEVDVCESGTSPLDWADEYLGLSSPDWVSALGTDMVVGVSWRDGWALPSGGSLSLTVSADSARAPIVFEGTGDAACPDYLQIPIQLTAQLTPADDIVVDGPGHLLVGADGETGVSVAVKGGATGLTDTAMAWFEDQWIDRYGITDVGGSSVGWDHLVLIEGSEGDGGIAILQRHASRGRTGYALLFDGDW